MVQLVILFGKVMNLKLEIGSGIGPLRDIVSVFFVIFNKVFVLLMIEG